MRKSTTTLALGAVLTAGVLLAPSALADTVTQAVTGGTRTASVADLALTSIATEHIDKSSTGSMALAVDDSTGTALRA